MIRITRAYCVELDRTITISEARREFLSLDPPIGKFNFLCSDEKCRAKGTRVTGVNYRESAREAIKFVTAHFRLQDEHQSDCEWVLPSVESEYIDDLLPGEKQDIAHARRTRKKLTDFIDIFDPRVDDQQQKAERSLKNAQSPDQGELEKNSIRAENSEISDEASLTKTNDLERLVETYLEAKSLLSYEDCRRLELRIVNSGKIRLTDYFWRLSHATLDTRNRVLYGGANLVKRYGLGFRFNFYDKINGCPVNLYIPTHTMMKYRHKKYIESILGQAPNVRYFTVYALGQLEPVPNEKFINLVVKDMRHLAIVLGPKKTGGPEKVFN
ncbi:MAG: hypothetical protein M0041_02160 [Nitrospiraceae bacterium]|nr:hypothetical protein [Nitrospiraceae bacterium]